MDSATLILFGLGFVLLIGGAEALVRGASRLALAAGLSPLVVGLTVVAFGTSAPELAVSLQSSLTGQADIAVGNAVGSNIFNILFILGAAAVITPLRVAQRLVRLEVPLMIGVSALLWALTVDGRLGRLDGSVLFAGMVVYTVFAIRQSRRESALVKREYAAEFDTRGPASYRDLIVQGALILGGLAALVLGARWLVRGAVLLARTFGLSELIIGLTIVAAGTSLPEVATSIVASLRGERDIAVGNVVGSNIFNILAVLGLAAIVAPNGVVVSSAALSFDIPVMIAAALACLPVFVTGGAIARWEGALFLAYFVAYTLYLVLNAVGHDAAVQLTTVMAFAVPLTAVTLAVLAFRGRIDHSGAPSETEPR
jgi:cation:H+ antiporter